MKPSESLHRAIRTGKLALLGAVLMFLGCQSLILDPRGHQVPEEKWVTVPEAGEQSGRFESEDLTVTYKMIRTHGQVRIFGEIRFADRIANSFPIIQYFNLGVLLLDGQGKILDIGNLISVSFFRTQAATVPDYPLLFNALVPFGGSIRYLAFNYTGRGIDPAEPGGSTMDFWEFPVY